MDFISILVVGNASARVLKWCIVNAHPYAVMLLFFQVKINRQKKKKKKEEGFADQKYVCMHNGCTW